MGSRGQVITGFPEISKAAPGIEAIGVKTRWLLCTKSRACGEESQTPCCLVHATMFGMSASRCLWWQRCVIKSARPRLLAILCDAIGDAGKLLRLTSIVRSSRGLYASPGRQLRRVIESVGVE